MSETNHPHVLTSVQNAPSGVLLIDKPEGPTSQRIVSILKRKLPKGSKIGHLGTLDPFASGLLPILVGGATRLSDLLMVGNKEYLLRIQFGTQTTTLDTEGEVVVKAEIPSDWQVKLSDVLQKFRGKILQIPPEYSALKMDGLPLYEHMRRFGSLPRDISVKSREVEILELELTDFWRSESSDLGSVDLRVSCTKGTYIRSLARDISISLGTVGHCSKLRRSGVGDWSVTDAFSGEVSEFKDLDLTSSKEFLSVSKLLPNLLRIALPEEVTRLARCGNSFQLALSQLPGGLSEKIQNFPSGKALVTLNNSGMTFLADFEVRLETEDCFFQPRKRIL